jgi:hypothetical protein
MNWLMMLVISGHASKESCVPCTVYKDINFPLLHFFNNINYRLPYSKGKKVKFTLCLTKYHTMKMYPVLKHHTMKMQWGVEV